MSPLALTDRQLALVRNAALKYLARFDTSGEVSPEVRHATSVSRETEVRTTPLALTDRQLQLVTRAARALPLMHRDWFLQNVAARLAAEPSDAAVMQAINSVFDRIPIFLA
jgi:hypothetical protein